MSALVSDTIVPWLLGTLLLLMVLTLAITLKSWRDLKRSPYFFLRRQAEKKLQSYLMASLALMMLTAATSAFAWQEPEDTTPRVAVLTNAKPPREDIVALFQESAVAETAVTETTLLAETTPDILLAAVEPEADQTLPVQFDRFEPTANLNQDTDIGTLAFSTEVSDRYQAINPAKIFAEGFYTLYATFDYAQMADGMEWAWVWRLNGEVIEGGNELWAYGSNGPGYIYFSPEDGFKNGEYSLQVWVNGEMLAQSEVVMNNAAFASGN